MTDVLSAKDHAREVIQFDRISMATERAGLEVSPFVSSLPNYSLFSLSVS
jgi:hypothetical protein